MSPIHIERDTIPSLQFPRDEVLDSDSEMEQRVMDAYKGMLMGNIYKGKVKIIFGDQEGIKQVETIIWEVTEHRILLKKGIQIPLHRVYKIIT